MHISEGVLAAPVLAAGLTLTLAGTAVGLKKIDYQQMPRVAIMTSAFFVASFIHVPIGPSSVHLILNGLLGLFLGWMVFPAALTALLLQAVLFQFGGLTTLGVNTVNMALPAVICGLLFRSMVGSRRELIASTAAFLCGFLAVLLAGLLAALSLFFSGEAFLGVAKLVMLAHLPVMVIEGLITVFGVRFIKHVRPEMLAGPEPAR
ncbi:MAG: cobalt transporter CbiM [Deltaproteobacteria bacterium]|nr:cobalt transporter CbiM [Candidatus Anaeroferrophillacea bacterium]